MFDVVISFRVIEHIADIDQFMVQIKQRVKPGGIVLITTPNVKTDTKKDHKNPFHINEMNYTEFQTFIAKYFHNFTMIGIGYASPNKLREILVNSPFYSLGKLLKRGSRIKKLATRVTHMTNFSIIEKNVPEDAIDLFAACIN